MAKLYLYEGDGKYARDNYLPIEKILTRDPSACDSIMVNYQCFIFRNTLPVTSKHGNLKAKDIAALRRAMVSRGLRATRRFERRSARARYSASTRSGHSRFACVGCS